MAHIKPGDESLSRTWQSYSQSRRVYCNAKCYPPGYVGTREKMLKNKFCLSCSSSQKLQTLPRTPVPQGVQLTPTNEGSRNTAISRRKYLIGRSQATQCKTFLSGQLYTESQTPEKKQPHSSSSSISDSAYDHGTPTFPCRKFLAEFPGHGVASSPVYSSRYCNNLHYYQQCSLCFLPSTTKLHSNVPLPNDLPLRSEDPISPGSADQVHSSHLSRPPYLLIASQLPPLSLPHPGHTLHSELYHKHERRHVSYVFRNGGRIFHQRRTRSLPSRFSSCCFCSQSRIAKVGSIFSPRDAQDFDSETSGDPIRATNDYKAILADMLQNNKEIGRKGRENYIARRKGNHRHCTQARDTQGMLCSSSPPHPATKGRRMLPVAASISTCSLEVDPKEFSANGSDNIQRTFCNQACFLLSPALCTSRPDFQCTSSSFDQNFNEVDEAEFGQISVNMTTEACDSTCSRRQIQKRTSPLSSYCRKNGSLNSRYVNENQVISSHQVEYAPDRGKSPTSSSHKIEDQQASLDSYRSSISHSSSVEDTTESQASCPDGKNPENRSDSEFIPSLPFQSFNPRQQSNQHQRHSYRTIDSSLGNSPSEMNSIPASKFSFQLDKAIRIPAEVIAEMFSNVSKGARLQTEFVRKCEAVQYLMGIPWLEHQTRKWICFVLCFQLLSWAFCVLSTATAAFLERISQFTLVLLAPFLTLHHFVGYMSFVRRSSMLSAVYCIIVVVTGALQGMQFASSVRELTLLKPIALTLSFLVTLLSSIGGFAADLSLFFAAATLFLRMLQEESEMHILIPIERLEETPNDLPFLRWYFNLPLGDGANRQHSSNE